MAMAMTPSEKATIRANSSSRSPRSCGACGSNRCSGMSIFERTRPIALPSVIEATETGIPAGSAASA